MGIDVAGESQLVGFPSQFPSVSMVDWNDGRPNARYWVLHLIKHHFAPGDTLVDTTIELKPNQPYVHAQAFVTRGGERKILLVNKRDRPFEVTLPESRIHIEVVDQTTAFKPPSSSDATNGSLTLGGYGVAVVTLRQE
jgi:hypothetical protein